MNVFKWCKWETVILKLLMLWGWYNKGYWDLEDKLLDRYFLNVVI